MSSSQVRSGSGSLHVHARQRSRDGAFGQSESSLELAADLSGPMRGGGVSRADGGFEGLVAVGRRSSIEKVTLINQTISYRRKLLQIDQENPVKRVEVLERKLEEIKNIKI